MHTMETLRMRIVALRSRRAGTPGLLGGLLILTTATGCARALTIRQDAYINTAPHANRPPDKRTGEPLEVTIAVLYPADLKKPGNELLRADSKITCRDWYQRRPMGTAQEGSQRFDLPKNQIFVLTNDDKVYGRHLGPALRGAVLDGDKPVHKANIAIDWGMVHNRETVIYVFPKFIGRDGQVLPVRPAKFAPPGAYTADLEVRIGVHPSQDLDEAQFIEVLSPRKLYRDEAK